MPNGNGPRATVATELRAGFLHGLGATAILLVLLVIAVAWVISPARRHWLLGCPKLESLAGGTAAPNFCWDVATPKKGTGAERRAQIIAYGKRLDWDTAAGDRRQPLNPWFNQVEAELVPERNAVKLTRADLMLRGRLVGRIRATEPYAHGIQYRTTYVWVDWGPFRGIRVVLVPDSEEQPVSVLASYRFDPDEPAGSPFSRMVDLRPQSDSAAWHASLPEWVKQCVGNQQRACWVHEASSTASGPSVAANRLGLLTDGWIWVTGQGCVCIGTKCHS